MNLKYRILWFEDDPEVINHDIGPQIINFLDELGFKLEIIHHHNGEQLDALIKNVNLDLIVTDLNLGEHETGEQIIEHIRSGEIYTEVLLYSANAGDINAIVQNKGWIERASFSVGIGNVAAKLKSIIELTIKKTQDVNNTRGLVIAETIDLEKKIETILLKYFETTEEIVLPDNKKKLLEHIHSKKVEQHTKDVERILNINFAEIKTLIDEDILTASNSFDAIQSILKEKVTAINTELNNGKIDPTRKEFLSTRLAEVKMLKEELNNFRSEILQIRNTLAHVKEEIDDAGIPFLNSINKEGAAIKFDNQKYIEIRKNLAKHSLNLSKILEHIEN